MSNNASVMFRTDYQNRASAIYQQRGGRLRGAVSQATRFEGSSKAKFFLAGKSKAYKTKYAGQTNTPSGMGITPFTVDLETWTVYDHIHEFDEDRMTIDEKEIVYEAGAKAMGRATDIEIFEKAHAKVTTFTPGCDFSAGGFEAKHAMTMCKEMQEQMKGWDGDVFCPLPTQAWNELMLNKLFNSSDHVGADDLPFSKMTDSRKWNGVNWFLYVEEDAEDMYPSSASGKQDILMFHKTALGWAAHSDLNVKTQWHNEIDTLSVNMKVKGAATTLQEGNGIVRGRVRTTGAMAVSE